MLNDVDLARIMVYTRKDIRALEKYQKVAKLMEEVGELSESLLIQDGIIKPGKEVEGPMGEVADAILCLVDILSIAYPDKDEMDLMIELDKVLYRKWMKWKSYMEFGNERVD